MRLFAALAIAEEAVDEIAAWWTAASSCLPASQWREIPRERWHITLAFYGEVDGRDYNRLALALEECATACGPMQLGVLNYGAFPNARRPRVFWIGAYQVSGDCTLSSFAGCCSRAGRANVRKHSAKSPPFQGHITLARYRGVPEPLNMESLQGIPGVPSVTWTVDRLDLMRSILHRDGARYQVLEEFRL